MKSAKSTQPRKRCGFLLSLLLLILCLLFTGCERPSFLFGKNDGKDRSPEQDNIEAGGKLQDDPVTPEILPTNRFTGLACDESVSSCRPLSVCIANFDGKAQYGLSFADILIESPIENGATRLLAIGTGWASLEKIGPVASVREYMMPFLTALDCISVYAGTTDVSGVAHANYPGDNLDSFSQTYNDLFRKETDGTVTVSGEGLQNAAKNGNYSLKDSEKKLPYTLVADNTTVRPAGNPVSSIKLNFSAVNHAEFRFNAENGLYTRYQDNAPHTDALTGEALTFSNVILLFHNVTSYHSEGNTTFTLDTEAGGSGFCYTGGGAIRIRWSYGSDGLPVFRDENGNILELNRGRTYIGMMKITDTTAVIAK